MTGSLKSSSNVLIANVLALPLLACGAVIALPSPSPAGEAEPSGIYVRKDTWAETVNFLREPPRAYRAAWFENRDVKLGPWFTTGALRAKGFSDRLFPEEGVDLQAKGPGGRALWREEPKWRDGKVHNFSVPKNGLVYLFRTITAKRPTMLKAGIGSDDGVELWLTGRKLFSKNVGGSS